MRFEGPNGSLNGVQFNDTHAVKVFYQHPVDRVRFGLGRSKSFRNDKRMFSLASGTGTSATSSSDCFWSSCKRRDTPVSNALLYKRFFSHGDTD